MYKWSRTFLLAALLVLPSLAMSAQAAQPSNQDPIRRLMEPCPTFNILLNTGYDQVNAAVYPTGAVDGFYTVLHDPDANTSEPRQANVITKYSSWQLPVANSQWISNYPGSENTLDGTYIFETCFCLETGFTDALIRVGCRADNEVSVYLNETVSDILNNIAVPIHVGEAFNVATMTFTDFAVQARFNTGENCIQFRVDNTSGVAMGLNADLSVTASGGGLIESACCNTSGGLQGQKWNDLNGDGVRQSGEPVMAGWTINLSTGASAVTDAFGWYYFNDLAPGTYTVTETGQAGWQQTAPTSGSYEVTLSARQYVGSLDFGNHEDPCQAFSLQLNTGFDQVNGAVYPIGAIDGFYTVRHDPDANTSEPRQANVITKYSSWQLPVANSQWISNYPGAQNTKNGPYIFETCFCLEDGFTDALIRVGCRADDQVSVYLNETVSDILNNIAVPIHVGQAFGNATMTFTDFANQARFHPGENCVQFRVDNLFSVAMGLNASLNVSASGGGLSASVCCDSTGGLQGQKWNDINGDGVRQVGEPVMAGWTINLSTGATAVTDAFGWYYFNDLAPGNYTVTETGQPGWQMTAPAGGSHTVTVSTRQYIGDLDFGNRRVSHVGVNKDLRNTTGQVANDIEMLLEGAYAASDIQHYDGQGNYAFSSFTVTPDTVSGNTRLHWQGPPVDVAAGDVAHVGFVVPGSSARVLGVFWSRDGAVTGCAHQCETGTHQLGGPGGRVVYTNNSTACDSVSRYVGDLTVEWHASEVPLADLIAGVDRQPLRVDVVSQAPVLLAPGDTASVAVPAAPAGATFAVLVHKVGSDPLLTGPDVTVDYLEFPLQEPATSGVDDTLDSGTAGSGFRFRINNNPLQAGNLVIQFDLPEADEVSVDLYDLRGRRISSLPSVSLAAGAHDLRLEPRDESGRRLSSGVYLVQVTFHRTGSSQARPVTILE